MTYYCVALLAHKPHGKIHCARTIREVQVVRVAMPMLLRSPLIFNTRARADSSGREKEERKNDERHLRTRYLNVLSNYLCRTAVQKPNRNKICTSASLISIFVIYVENFLETFFAFLFAHCQPKYWKCWCSFVGR